jgi:hypothetical protein
MVSERATRRGRTARQYNQTQKGLAKKKKNRIARQCGSVHKGSQTIGEFKSLGNKPQKKYFALGKKCS